MSDKCQNCVLTKSSDWSQVESKRVFAQLHLWNFTWFKVGSGEYAQSMNNVQTNPLDLLWMHIWVVGSFFYISSSSFYQTALRKCYLMFSGRET